MIMTIISGIAFAFGSLSLVVASFSACRGNNQAAGQAETNGILWFILAAILFK